MAQISIIVPIYNVERYVRRALDSLTTQTLHDIEIICVDDCGTDNSMSIVNEYAATDARIKIIKNPHNMDIADTRNAGMAAASAPYIMWCDPDDWYDDNMCAEMLRAMHENAADIAMCGTNVIYETDGTIKHYDDRYFAVDKNCTQDVSDAVARSTNVCVWNKIFRRDIIEKYKLRFPSKLRYEDEFFFRAYMCYARKITFITDKLYNYRRNGGSIMNQTFNKTAKYATDALHVAIEYQRFLAERKLYDRKYDEFWAATFPTCVRLTLMRIGTRKDAQRTFDIAADFIRQQYTRPASDTYARRVINMVLGRKYVPMYRNVLCRAVQYVNNEFRRELKIGPMSIYKVKRDAQYDIICVLGIPLIKRKIMI